MKSLVKLVLPLVLGAIAAGMNWYYLTHKLQPKTFTVAKAAIAEGERFEYEALAPLTVEGGMDKFLATAIPYADSAVLVHQVAPRSFKPGDLLLWRDVQPVPTGLPFADEEERGFSLSLRNISVMPSMLKPGDMISFAVAAGEGTAQEAATLARALTRGNTPGGAAPENPAAEKAATRAGGVAPHELLGPFRLLSVGRRVSPDLPLPAELIGVDEGRTITVAIRVQGEGFDDLANRLIAAVDGRTSRRIVGVVLHPRAAPPEPGAAAAPATAAR